MKKLNVMRKENLFMQAAPELFRKVRKMVPLETVVALANLIVCVKVNSYFLIACSAYSFVNVFIRAILFGSRKDMYGRCVAGGLVALFASLGILGCGASMFFVESQVIGGHLAVIIMLLTGINMLFTLYYYLEVKKYRGLMIKTFSFLNYANGLILLSLVVSVTLSISSTDESTRLVAMTGMVLGGGTAGLTGYILREILLTNEKIQKLYEHFRNNSTIIFTRLSLKKDVVMVLGKLILSYITFSGFILVNALYSAGMGIARYSAIRARGKEQRKQIRSYFEIGVAIFGGSICYVVYSIGMFAGRKSPQFNFNIALIIAAYTFTELFLIIRDYIRARKEKNLISEEIKLIGLSSTLICLVLTQTAIMSISYEGDASFYNGLSGIVFGGMAALLGLYMMIRSRSLKRRTDLSTEDILE